MAPPAEPAGAPAEDTGAWERLKAALRTATVALESSRPGARDTGTGFFVGPGLVLTCAHVALPGGLAPSAVRGRWRRGTTGIPLVFSVDDMEVRPFDGGRGPDLALLRVSEGDLGDQPCAALSRGLARPPEGQRLHAYGHPGHDYSGGDAFGLRVVGGSWHKNGAELLKVGGSELWRGASGSPVIDPGSGCVIGVVRAKQRGTDPTADHEARLVPAPVVWDTFPALAEEQRLGWEPLERWLALLSDEQLRQGNWRTPGPRLKGYLTVLHEATARHSYVDVLHTVLSGRSGGARRPLPAGDIRVPVRARPGHGPEAGDPEAGGPQVEGPEAGSPERAGPRRTGETGGPCRPVDSTALLAGAHVVGEAGTGKSTLLRTVARDWARQWLNGTVGDYVPVYAAAPVMARGIGNDPWDPLGWLARAVSRDLSAAAGRCAGTVRLGTPVLPLPDVFRNPPFPARKWLLLVDGVDEVGSPEQRRQIQNALVAFANSPHFTVVLTSRDPLWFHGIEGAGLESLRLCRLSEEGRADLAEKCLAAFGTGSRGGGRAAEGFLRELERFGLAELAMRPMFCVVLCAVYADSGSSGLEGGRFRLFERLTGILLDGAAEGTNPLPASREELRALLAAHAAELREPRFGLRPTLNELIGAMPSRRLAGPGDDPWVPSVRAYLHSTGLISPDAPDDQPFSHELLVDYFAARAWARHTAADARAVRQVAEDCMKRERESYALFRAAHLLTVAPGVIADELGSWSGRRRNQAAVMIAKLAAEAAPVPPELLTATAAALRRFSRRAGPAKTPPRRSPELPDSPGWPAWAAAVLPVVESAAGAGRASGDRRKG
ncbi:trypsin-like peptidase domain-containing protein [Streptomyces sp. NPDC051018]|uniref:trypsin-like peptidase domain-containing protein n=1 Tax=Streptomyces sp. NPDC051018 TaxID=3365639 RepID=UPI00379DDFB2